MIRRFVILSLVGVALLATGCNSSDPTSSQAAGFGSVDVYVNESASGSQVFAATTAAAGDVSVTINEMRLYSPGGDSAEIITEPVDVNLSGDILEQLSVPAGTYSCVEVSLGQTLTVVEGENTCTAGLPISGSFNFCFGNSEALVVDENGEYEFFLELPVVSGTCPQDGGVPSLQIETTGGSAQLISG